MIGQDVQIGRGAVVRRAILDKNVVIPAGALIGVDREQDKQRYFVSDTTTVRRALELSEFRSWRSGVGALAEWLSAARRQRSHQAAEAAA